MLIVRRSLARTAELAHSPNTAASRGSEVDYENELVAVALRDAPSGVRAIACTVPRVVW